MVREREVKESVSHAIIQVHLTGDHQDDDGYINTVSVGRRGIDRQSVMGSLENGKGLSGRVGEWASRVLYPASDNAVRHHGGW